MLKHVIELPETERLQYYAEIRHCILNLMCEATARTIWYMRLMEGMDQPTFANHLGIDVRQLQAFESGDELPSVDFLQSKGMCSQISDKTSADISDPNKLEFYQVFHASMQEITLEDKWIHDAYARYPGMFLGIQ